MTQRRARQLARAACFGALTATGTFVGAAEEEDREYSAEAAPRPVDMPLSPLPEVPSRDLARPRPAAIEALDRVLSRIVSEDPVISERASREIYEAKPDWVSAIARRIDDLAERGDRGEMGKLLDERRRRARDGLSADQPTPDYLDVLLAAPQPSSKTWRDLTQLLAQSRMLVGLESTPAVRELIRIYVRFGEFVRIDTQRQLEKLGDKAVAALIEAERHPAEKIGAWASRQLDLRGKAIPHEAVRTEDQRALADILVALGYGQNPDAGRLLISFAGSERSEVRTAARQGIVLLGEAGAWQLKDAYLDLTGRKPAREWTWKRTARELFTEFDRMRLAQVFRLFQEGRALEKDGKLEEMAQRFDEVLTRSPRFEQAGDMAPGYLALASHEGTPEDRALDAARRAERLAQSPELRNRAHSLRLTLEAERLRRRGVFDRALLERALELDPNNEAARVDVATGGHKQRANLSPWARYTAALTICGLAFSTAVWILWTARNPGKKTPTRPAPDPGAPGDTIADGGAEGSSQPPAP